MGGGLSRTMGAEVIHLGSRNGSGVRSPEAADRVDRGTSTDNGSGFSSLSNKGLRDRKLELEAELTEVKRAQSGITLRWSRGEINSKTYNLLYGELKVQRLALVAELLELQKVATERNQALGSPEHSPYAKLVAVCHRLLDAAEEDYENGNPNEEIVPSDIMDEIAELVGWKEKVVA